MTLHPDLMLNIRVIGEKMRNGIICKYKTYGAQQNVRIPLKMRIWTGQDRMERDKYEK
jgi:hypothetical protein